jgi:hypothetical protein
MKTRLLAEKEQRIYAGTSREIKQTRTARYALKPTIQWEMENKMEQELTHEQVERERLRGEQELNKLREHYRDKAAARQAEVDADRWEFQRQQEEAYRPQRQRDLAKARQIIVESQLVLRSYSLNEANISLLLSVIDPPNMSLYAISQAIDSHAVSLTPPTSEEQEAWRLADIEQHNRELQELSIPELKRRVRERSVNVAAASEKQNREALEAQQQRDQDHGGYPPLPTHTPEGQPIDAQFLKKMCNTDLPRYKFYLKKYSASALTARLQGRQ